MKKGLFITFEGGEGCGKTTQIRLLADRLQRLGQKVFLTREPGGTGPSDAIRKILLNKKSGNLHAVTETLLYMASRSEIVDKVIAQQLKQGKIILCDRWLDSTVAYQGFGGSVDPVWILALAAKVTRGIVPDRTVFIDLPVQEGLRRAAGRGARDRMESKAIQYHEKVRKGYQWIAKKEPWRVKTVSCGASDDREVIAQKIWDELEGILG